MTDSHGPKPRTRQAAPVVEGTTIAIDMSAVPGFFRALIDLRFVTVVLARMIVEVNVALVAIAENTAALRK